MLVRFGVLLISIFVSSLMPLSAFAQNDNLNTQEQGSFDVTVSPTFIEVSAKPGATVNQSVRLRNNTEKMINVKPEIKAMGANEAGELTIKDTNEEHIKWLTIKNESISLRPREWSTVSFSIKIPESAAYGYYWAVSFTSEGGSITQGPGSSVTASLAVPILLSVQKPGAKTEGNLLDFKTDSAMYEYPPVKFTIKFQNSGNVHIRPQGNIFIEDFFGNPVATLNINENQGGILPQTFKNFENTWNDGFIVYEPKEENGNPKLDENGKPQMDMKMNWQKILDLRIGRYTATALVLISGEQRDYTYEKTITFFVFPWKVVLIIIAITIFVGIGLFTTSRTIFRKIKGIFKKK